MADNLIPLPSGDYCTQVDAFGGIDKYGLPCVFWDNAAPTFDPNDTDLQNQLNQILAKAKAGQNVTVGSQTNSVLTKSAKDIFLTPSGQLAGTGILILVAIGITVIALKGN